jgi:hypothetical protein
MSDQEQERIVRRALLVASDAALGCWRRGGTLEEIANQWKCCFDEEQRVLKSDALREHRDSERGEFRFTVKESHDGKPWIAFEPAGRELISKGLLGFDLKEGKTLDGAREVADYLNHHIRMLSLTPE